MELLTPTLDHLPSYVEALKRGFAPGTSNPDAVRRAAFERIAEDPALYISQMTDLDAAGPDVLLGDGTYVKRLPGVTRWMWDGEFAGVLSLRWQAGTDELPEYCLGHIGYSVCEWKQRRGYATAAVAAILPFAKSAGLKTVEITTTPDNYGSQKVILNNGGQLEWEGNAPERAGGGPLLRFRIQL